MASRFPDLTFFIDAGGRYSHSKEVPIVFAGIAVAAKDVNEIQDSLLTAANGPLCKWSNGEETKEYARVIFRFLSKRQLIGVVRTVWKNTPEWDKYFNKGERHPNREFKGRRSQCPMPSQGLLLSCISSGVFAVVLRAFLPKGTAISSRRKVPPLKTLQ